MQKNLIITLLFSILIALFAIMNASAIPINLLLTQINVSTALVILISASLGAIVVYSVDAVSKIKNKKIIKGHEKKEADFLNELNQLKDQLYKSTQENIVLKEQIEAQSIALNDCNPEQVIKNLSNQNSETR